MLGDDIHRSTLAAPGSGKARQATGNLGTNHNNLLVKYVARLCRAYDFDPLKEAQAFQQAAPVAKREETAPKPPQHVSRLLQTPLTGSAGKALTVLYRCGCSLYSATNIIATCMVSRCILT